MTNPDIAEHEYEDKLATIRQQIAEAQGKGDSRRDVTGESVVVPDAPRVCAGGVDNQEGVLGAASTENKGTLGQHRH